MYNEQFHYRPEYSENIPVTFIYDLKTPLSVVTGELVRRVRGTCLNEMILNDPCINWNKFIAQTSHGFAVMTFVRPEMVKLVPQMIAAVGGEKNAFVVFDRAYTSEPPICVDSEECHTGIIASDSRTAADLSTLYSQLCGAIDRSRMNPFPEPLDSQEISYLTAVSERIAQWSDSSDKQPYSQAPIFFYENGETGRVRIFEREVDLTGRELQILRYLAQKSNVPVSKEELYTLFYGSNCLPTGDMSVVEVTVRRLREKIEVNPSEPNIVLTRRGMGYQLNI